MQNQVIIDASRARQRFFELLDLVEKDQKEFLIRKRGKVKAKLVQMDESKPTRAEIKKRLRALEKLTGAGGTTMNWPKMKKIISSKNMPHF